MSGSLANRLVEAAWEQMKGPPYTNWSYGELPARAKARVGATVAAVLRELDRTVMERVASGSSDFIDLEELAGVVEGGEQQ